MTENDYIYEVYKERSFSSAAKNLYVSQPALSASIKKAEERLGFSIFDRSTSPISVTQEGLIYIESIEKINRINEETLTKLSDIGKLKYGHLTVCGENFVSSFIMPKIIHEYSKKYPGIELELVESNSPDLRLQILNESVDLLIAHDFNGNLFDFEPLFSETLLLAVPTSFEINDTLKEYQLSTKDVIDGKHLNENCPKISLSLFKEQPFILLKKGNDTYRRAKQLFEEQNFTPQNVVINLDQLITSYNMACAGLGVIFVSDIVVKTSKQQGVVFYKLSGNSVYRTMQIGYKKNRYVSKAMSEFIKIAKEVYKNN